MTPFEEWLDAYTDEHGAPYAQGSELKDAWDAGVNAEIERQKDLRKTRAAARKQRRIETRRRRQEYIDMHRGDQPGWF